MPRRSPAPPTTWSSASARAIPAAPLAESGQGGELVALYDENSPPKPETRAAWLAARLAATSRPRLQREYDLAEHVTGNHGGESICGVGKRNRPIDKRPHCLVLAELC